jgi:hypothetical protein
LHSWGYKINVTSWNSRVQKEKTETSMQFVYRIYATFSEDPYKAQKQQRWIHGFQTHG